MTFYTATEKKALKRHAEIRQTECTRLANEMARSADKLRRLLGGSPNSYSGWRDRVNTTRRDIDLIEERAAKTR